jgi:hypothetical protein
MAGNDTYITTQLPAEPAGPPVRTRPAVSCRSVSWWRRFVAAIPLRFALLITAAVWAMGCVWSFREQTLFAHAKGFHLPWLLPAVIDGLAIALACVAYAASLDGRPGVVARLGTAVAVAASAASNATFAWQRSGDTTTVVLAAGVPVAANLAFEVLLHELRRQVLRRRGLPAPVAVPYPRMIRLVLAPVSTLHQWRRLVLDLTVLEPPVAVATPGAHDVADAPASAATTWPGARAAVADTSAHRTADASARRMVVEPLTPNDLAADASAAPRRSLPHPSTGASLSLASRFDTRPSRLSNVGHAVRADTRADADTASGTGADARIDTDAAGRADAHAAGFGPVGADASAARPRVAEADTPLPPRPVDAGTLAEQARQRYRASLAAGDPLTGRQLGRMYHRSPSWGRERIGEVKADDRDQASGQANRSTGTPARPARPTQHDRIASSPNARARNARYLWMGREGRTFPSDRIGLEQDRR